MTNRRGGPPPPGPSGQERQPPRHDRPGRRETGRRSPVGQELGQRPTTVTHTTRVSSLSGGPVSWPGVLGPSGRGREGTGPTPTSTSRRPVTSPICRRRKEEASPGRVVRRTEGRPERVRGRRDGTEPRHTTNVVLTDGERSSKGRPPYFSV